eukprot:127280_1
MLSSIFFIARSTRFCLICYVFSLRFRSSTGQMGAHGAQLAGSLEESEQIAAAPFSIFDVRTNEVVMCISVDKDPPRRAIANLELSPTCVCFRTDSSTSGVSDQSELSGVHCARFHALDSGLELRVDLQFVTTGRVMYTARVNTTEGVFIGAAGGSIQEAYEDDNIRVIEDIDCICSSADSAKTLTLRGSMAWRLGDTFESEPGSGTGDGSDESGSAVVIPGTGSDVSPSATDELSDTIRVHLSSDISVLEVPSPNSLQTFEVLRSVLSDSTLVALGSVESLKAEEAGLRHTFQCISSELAVAKARQRSASCDAADLTDSSIHRGQLSPASIETDNTTLQLSDAGSYDIQENVPVPALKPPKPAPVRISAPALLDNRGSSDLLAVPNKQKADDPLAIGGLMQDLRTRRASTWESLHAVLARFEAITVEHARLAQMLLCVEKAASISAIH